MKKRAAIFVALMVLSLLAVSVSTTTAAHDAEVERNWRCYKDVSLGNPNDPGTGTKTLTIHVNEATAQQLAEHGWSCFEGM
jgi:hypothetical protein